MTHHVVEEIHLPEAALALKRSYFQVREMLFRGELEGRKAGGRLWVSRASLERALGHAPTPSGVSGSGPRT